VWQLDFERLIAYGLLIDTWDEMSTLGGTNKTQFFVLESCAIHRNSSSGTYGPLMIQFVSLVHLQSRCYLQEPKTLLKNWEIEEPEFCIFGLSKCSNGSCLSAYHARSPCIGRVN
jgi:hypothetical protein